MQCVPILGFGRTRNNQAVEEEEKSRNGNRKGGRMEEARRQRVYERRDSYGTAQGPSHTKRHDSFESPLLFRIRWVFVSGIIEMRGLLF